MHLQTPKIVISIYNRILNLNHQNVVFMIKSKSLLLTTCLGLASFTAAVAQTGDYPANAQAGKCYAKCMIADEYQTVTEQVLTKPASKRTEVVPAVYQTVTEQIMVKEASKKIMEGAAEYKTETEQIVVKEASKRVEATPAVFETVTEQIMVKPASKKLVEVPAEYGMETQQVVAKTAGKRLEIIPAVYETKTETMLVKPESERLEPLQHKYETKSEQKEVAPATTKWVKKRGSESCLSANPDDCLVWCLVEVPAQYQTVTTQVDLGCYDGGSAVADCVRRIKIPAEYKTITKQMVTTQAQTREIEIPAEYRTETRRVVKSPAKTREIEIPAEYKTITKQVEKVPAQTREIDIPAEYKTVTRSVKQAPRSTEVEIPAEYKTITKSVVSAAAQTRDIEIPAEYKTVTYKKLVRKGGFTEWKEVMCGEKVNEATVRQVQEALRTKGYNPGPSDNVLGAQTKAALVKYQKDNGLPMGSLDRQTLNSLGLGSLMAH